MKKIFLFTVISLIFIFRTVCYANDIDKEIIDNAGVTYETDFIVNTTLERWNQILDNPYLMGKIWEAYEFSPQYSFSKIGPGVHVIDPTGIVGDVFNKKVSNNSRNFYCTGKLDHRLLPLKINGKAIFVLTNTSVQNLVHVKLNIYIKGDSKTINIGMKAISPLFEYLINNRITCHVRDIRKIVEDIEQNPGKIRDLLSSKNVSDFNMLLNENR